MMKKNEINQEILNLDKDGVVKGFYERTLEDGFNFRFELVHKNNCQFVGISENKAPGELSPLFYIGIVKGDTVESILSYEEFLALKKRE